MTNYEFKNPNNDIYVRISKKAAKKHFLSGKNIYICMCNVRPFGYWYDFGTYINKAESGYINISEYFDQFINAYTYYNANYEMGYYPSYYIKQNEM